jgi:predicted nucleic acid-binding protein
VKIAIDTCSLVAFLDGEEAEDTEAVLRALANRQAVLPPVVVTELLSRPALPIKARNFTKRIPKLELLDGYWERVGLLRARLLVLGRKARLADTLIAQSCIDHRTALVTRDKDFRHFRPFGLDLLPLLQ